MLTIVGKIINERKQVVAYKVSDGKNVKIFNVQDMYNLYRSGSLPIIKSFDINTGKITLNNINDTLIPVFYNDKCVNNSIAVVKIIKQDNKQIGAIVTDFMANLVSLRLSDIVNLVNKEITLYNAKIVNDNIFSKFGEFEVLDYTAKRKSDVNVSKEKKSGVEDSSGETPDMSAFEIDYMGILRNYNGVVPKILNIPSGIKIKLINKEAFMNNENIEVVSIPGSVTGLEEQAFKGCKNLRKVIIREGVKYLGDSAFEDCGKLSEVIIEGNTVITSTAFKGTPWYIDMQKKAIADGCFEISSGVLDKCYNKDMKFIVVPEGVEVIMDKAFENCCMQNIILPDSIKRIRFAAFNDCKYLKSISIPPKVVSIEAYTFNGCVSLENIEMPEKDRMGVWGIGNGAFMNCTSLKRISGQAGYLATKEDVYDSISWYLRYVGDGAFYNCLNLTTVQLFINLEYIGKEAFKGCKSLREICFGSAVKAIDSSAFDGCTNVEVIVMNNSDLADQDYETFNYENGSEIGFMNKKSNDIYRYCMDCKKMGKEYGSSFQPGELVPKKKEGYKAFFECEYRNNMVILMWSRCTAHYSGFKYGEENYSYALIGAPNNLVGVILGSGIKITEFLNRYPEIAGYMKRHA